MPFQPTLSQVHVDTVSTQFSIAYVQNTGRHFARKIFPVVPVDKKTGKYFVFDKGSLLRNEAKRRSPGTAPAESGNSMTTASYECAEWALRHGVADEIRSQADFDTVQGATNFVTEKMLIAEDVEFVSNFIATGKWATDYVGGTDFSKWSLANSTPRADFISAIRVVQKSTGFKPNKLSVTPDVFDTLIQHADFRSLMPDNVDRLVTAEFIAKAIGVDEVIELDSVYNSAAEGQTASMAHIAGTGAALLSYADPNPQLMAPTAGLILSWGEFDGVGQNGAVSMRRYRDADEGKGLEWFDGRSYADQVLTASDLGFFFSAAV